MVRAIICFCNNMSPKNHYIADAAASPKIGNRDPKPKMVPMPNNSNYAL